MKPDPHCKPLRRMGWAALAVALLAVPATANAQGLFFMFGTPSPDDIARRLQASGYVVTGPLVLRGDVYLADVVVRGEGPERLIIEPRSGRILQRFRVRSDRWREATAPPVDTGEDDPRLLDGPRPPADVGPGAAPPYTAGPNNWAPSAPVVVETPKVAPRRAESKPKPPAVADVTNPPAAQPSPLAVGKPAASPALVKPLAPPTPAASATPSPSTVPPLQAKADAEGAAKPSTGAPTAAAPAKSKSVNDIPVTPLD